MTADHAGQTGGELPKTADGGWVGGFGVVGLGVSGPPRNEFSRPDLCAGLDHPPATYNPWSDSTWCLCGRRVRPGDCVPGFTTHGFTIYMPELYRQLLADPEPRPADWAREPGTWCAVSDRPAAVQLDLFKDAA